MRNHILFVVILGLFFAILIPTLLPGKGEGDILAYWSAARLLATGGNPYDPQAMAALQQQTRPDEVLKKGVVMQTWNPPWLTLLLLPLGLLPYHVVVPVWIFCNFVVIGLAIRVAWQLAGGALFPRGFLYALAVGLLFGETLASIGIGQITGLVLLGLVLSLYWLEAGHDGRAGAALILAAIKPQVSYLLVLVIFIWVIRSKRWRVFIGVAVAGLVSLTGMWLVFPGWLPAYYRLVTNLPYTNLYTSTLGSFMEVLFGTKVFHYIALLLIPLAIPLAKWVKPLGWLAVANFSLLISVPLSPYGFGFDQVVLLAAIVQIVAWLWQREVPRRAAWIVGATLAATYLGHYWMLAQRGLPYHWFFGIPVALLGVYTLAWNQRRKFLSQGKTR